MTPTIKPPTTPHRRRSRPIPRLQNTAPAWQRWLGAILSMAGGITSAAWGVHDLAAWVTSLRHGDGVVETESIILGLPLLGASIAALGPTLLVTSSMVQRHDKLLTRATLAVLAAMLVGIVLTLLGALAINATMALEGYRPCTVQGHNRVTVTTWAAAGTTCPPPPN